MAAIAPNPSNETAKSWAQYWAGSKGSDLDFTTGGLVGVPARRVVVGTVPTSGTLTLTQYYGSAVTFTAAQIYALNQVLDGQWIGATASSSTCYDLAVAW